MVDVAIIVWHVGTTRHVKDNVSMEDSASLYSYTMAYDELDVGQCTWFVFFPAFRPTIIQCTQIYNIKRICLIFRFYIVMLHFIMH